MIKVIEIMKEEDLRLIASLVDWSDKLMAKVFYETYGKVIQEKFAEYEEWKNKLKDWVQTNYGNSKVFTKKICFFLSLNFSYLKHQGE